MLKQITLGALIALGAATLAGISSLPAAAHDTRSVRVSQHGGLSISISRFRRDRPYAGDSRYGPRRRFLKRVRRGAIVCFAKPSRRYAYRSGRRGQISVIPILTQSAGLPSTAQPLRSSPTKISWTISGLR